MDGGSSFEAAVSMPRMPGFWLYPCGVMTALPFSVPSRMR
jgi:hypothetical protein